MSKPRVLRFGIQSLDKLIGTISYKDPGAKAKDPEKEVYGVDLSQKSDRAVTKRTSKEELPATSSLCVMGPDGTGKSLLSLHIASHYLADCLEEKMEATDNSFSLPKVFHISTDLTYQIALKNWMHFALDRPFARREPLVELREGRPLRKGAPIEIKLKQYYPAGNASSEKSIINYLERDLDKTGPQLFPDVCFVDLASRTAGDDWGFVHRLLSTLEEPDPKYPRHLVVLDAVEGFETLAGDLNAFGEKSSRRSRIAQVMRLAANKSHLVFVVEEARDERFPEEFVTDVVIRLRNIRSDRYSRRTVEIDKGRGQWSIRGQHPYVIRNGRGSTTGTDYNVDEPAVRDGKKGPFQSYIHVFPSLNYISREIMIDKYNQRDKPPGDKFAGFGIPYLDSMLAGTPEKPIKHDYSDPRGLPCGTTAALIGDSLTQKSQLGRAFLSRAFYPYADELMTRIRDVINRVPRPHTGKKLREALEPSRLEQRHPVTVMFTTQGVNNELLANDFHEWLAAAVDTSKLPPAAKKLFDAELGAHIKSYTICRRFEIHDVPSAILMHIFQRNIEEAQRKLFLLKPTDPLPPQNERFGDSWRIRVVIDDLNGFRNIFPEMLGDPLMLPSLLFMLRRQGVTALIIDTQTSGSPDLSITERFDSSVRELVQHRIYTWRLPFYGENRVAISLIPPLSIESAGVIRELRWDTQTEPERDRLLRVDPHFELYMGLEKGRPEPVPLEVRLYAETPSFKRYIEAEEKFFSEIFRPVVSRAKNEEPRVINWTEVSEYDALRDSARLQRDTRLDHTTILQVDEFWWLRRATQRRSGAFRQQWAYLNAETALKKDRGFVADQVADPFGVFQPPSRLSESEYQDKKITGQNNGDDERNQHRLDFFDNRCGYGFQRITSGDKQRPKTNEENFIDRVPFTWDFGFMLCNGKAWEEARAWELKQAAEAKSRGKDADAPNKPKLLVNSVWERLRKRSDLDNPNKKPGAPVSWRDFLKASKAVAEYQSYRTSAPAIAFDFTMLSPESFSCLILEMWLSESYDSLTRTARRLRSRKPRTTRERILDRVSERRWDWSENETRSRGDLAHKELVVALENERGMPLTEILKQRVDGISPPGKGGYSLELYKVWLLLIESLNFGDLIDSSSHLNFEFKSRDVSHNAVSARHWYKTASKFIDSLSPEQLENDWVPVRLPGHFTVRSDWFLAVAGGSRSGRLADQALDLLSSQRANITRLQEGIGLPTRILTDSDSETGIVTDPDSQSKLRTRLISMREEGRLANVQYGELRQLGAPEGPDGRRKDTIEKFYWLWRSGIWAYNRHSRIWHKWLNRSLLNWHSWRQLFGSTWTSGFEVYDLLNDMELGKGELKESLAQLQKFASWNHFHELRDILITELEQVSISAI